MAIKIFPLCHFNSEIERNCLNLGHSHAPHFTVNGFQDLSVSVRPIARESTISRGKEQRLFLSFRFLARKMIFEIPCEWPKLNQNHENRLRLGESFSLSPV